MTQGLRNIARTFAADAIECERWIALLDDHDETDPEFEALVRTLYGLEVDGLITRADGRYFHSAEPAMTGLTPTDRYDAAVCEAGYPELVASKHYLGYPMIAELATDDWPHLRLELRDVIARAEIVARAAHLAHTHPERSPGWTWPSWEPVQAALVRLYQLAAHD